MSLKEQLMTEQEAIVVLREVRFLSKSKEDAESEISEACLIAIDALEKMIKIQELLAKENG